jgi:hypothetical protein
VWPVGWCHKGAMWGFYDFMTGRQGRGSCWVGSNRLSVATQAASAPVSAPDRAQWARLHGVQRGQGRQRTLPGQRKGTAKAAPCVGWNTVWGGVKFDERGKNGGWQNSQGRQCSGSVLHREQKQSFQRLSPKLCLIRGVVGCAQSALARKMGKVGSLACALAHSLHPYSHVPKEAGADPQ